MLIFYPQSLIRMRFTLDLQTPRELLRVQKLRCAQSILVCRLKSIWMTLIAFLIKSLTQKEIQFCMYTLLILSLKLELTRNAWALRNHSMLLLQNTMNQPMRGTSLSSMKFEKRLISQVIFSLISKSMIKSYLWQAKLEATLPHPSQ